MIGRLALALAILYPSLVFAAIDVGPERAIAAPGVGVASGAQLDVSMATSGEETLVAWIDTTRGRTGAYVAVLSRDGERIDGSQRWLASNAFAVTITWTGSEYLALWTMPLGVMASTLDRDGATVVEPRLVANRITAFSNVAWIGSTGMLMYTRDSRSEAAIIDREGNFTRSGIAITSEFAHEARVVTDGTSFFVFWRRQHFSERQPIDSIFVARFGVDGTLQEAAPEPLWTNGRLLEPWDVAFDGQRFALVLSQRTSETTTTMHRVVLDPATLQQTKLAPIDLGHADAAGVEWNGTNFITFWMRHASARTRELRTLVFPPDSAEGVDGVPVTVLEQLHPTVDADGVWNGRALVIAWTTRDPVFFETDIVATTVTGLGASTRITLSLSHRWQSLAAIGTNGNESLVVWLDGSASNNEPRRMVGAHATGGVIDEAPRQYSETPWHDEPVVVFTGTMYLVVFNEIVPGTRAARIALRRIDVRGTPLDASPIHVGYGMGFGAAWNGRHLLVAYHSGGDIDAVRIAQDGTIVDATPLKIVTGRLPNSMSMASNGTDFLLVWSEGVEFGRPTPGLIDVHAIVISDVGVAVSALIDVASGPSNQRHPAVASHGGDYAIVYMHDATLTAKKVLRDGRLADTTAQQSGTFIAQAPFSYTPPAIASTPFGYMVAWERELPDHVGELWLARLDRNIALAESRAAVRSGLFGMQPTLTPRNDGALDLAYSRLVDDPSYGATMRIFIRRVEEAPDRRRSVRH
jgi:hypothetical protein